MTKQGYFAGIFALIFLCFLSCKKVDIQFGQDFIDNSYTKIIKTDTFTVNVSTVYVDSFATNGTGTGLAGVYRDNKFGLVRAATYMQLAPPADADIYENTGYDSARLVLKLKRTYYGDTTKPIHLAVYRVTDDINFKEDASQFFNSNSFATEASPLGEITTRLNPNVIKDSFLVIPISDVLGNEWMNMLQSRSDDIRSTVNFLLYFKGIAIKAIGNDGVVMGFQDSAHIDIHYSKRDLYKTDQVASFTLNSSNKQFNNISIDRSGSPIQNLGPSNKQINASLTGNTAYMQAITGSRVRLDIPNLRALLNAPGYVKISTATLLIKPVTASFDNIYRLPDTLRLSQTDGTNIPGADLINSSSTVQTGSLYIDQLYGKDTRYAYDLTSYLQTEIANSQVNSDGLILHPFLDKEFSTFNRLIMGSQGQKTDQLQLLIYYLSIQ